VLIGATAVAPLAWEPHLLTWGVLVVMAVAILLGHRRLTAASAHPIPWPRKQVLQLAGAGVALAVALTWPLADLAAHWSLTALVVQRLILLLVVSPLLLLGLPYDIVQWATRPVLVDSLLLRLQRPPVAIITVTVLVVGSMTPLFVHAESTSFLARGALAGLVVVAGLVLWLPVIGRIPGIPRLKPVVRFGYLVAQAVIPAFLSFIYIFSVHPLYHEFSRSRQAIGLRPLFDQQIAGFASKLSMLLVLLSVGGVVLARAPLDEGEFVTDDPLVWADVQRQFERADRSGSGPVPEPAGGPPPTDGREAGGQPAAEEPTGAEGPPPVEGLPRTGSLCAPGRTSGLTPDPSKPQGPRGEEPGGTAPPAQP